MKLYEIENHIEEALEKYYNSQDLETWEVIDEAWYNEALKQLEEAQNQKDELKTWILHKRQNDLSDIESIEKEITRLTELKTERQNKVKKAENFIKYLFWDLEKPIFFDNFKLGYSKSSRIIVDDESKIPNKYKKHIPKQIIPEEYKVDKNLLKGFFKEVKQIKWCRQEDANT